MNRTELWEMIENGENSRVEFKRDDVRPEKLGAEMAAMLNLNGGHIILGVEDDGAVSGLVREPGRAEEWVMEVARSHLLPPVIVSWEVLEWDADIRVGVISLPGSAPDKPYKAKAEPAWVTKVRVGSTVRDASREEEERLYQQSGRVDYGPKPVIGTTLDDLDHLRLRDYYSRVMDYESLPGTGSDEWETLLVNLGLAKRLPQGVLVTVDGMLLFGANVKRFLPQSGIRAVCYSGEDVEYATRADEDIVGAMVPLCARDGTKVETGLADRAWDFIRRNTRPSAHLDGVERVDRWEYPEEAVREVVVNALVHRDYSIAGTDVMISLFSDRLEVRSPGKLPNTVTIERLKAGSRYSRNQKLMNVMRDYGYVEARGMGIRLMVMRGMKAHNNTEPDFLEDETSFTVRLWK